MSVFIATCSQDSNFEKALHGIEHLQKLNSSDLEEGGSVGAGSELEDEGEDILAAGSLEEALEVSLCWLCFKWNPMQILTTSKHLYAIDIPNSITFSKAVLHCIA